ncbi:MAG: hypothetical protein O9328_02535 [Rhodobacteraceae bacterium]|nr:hypothetical protein [Paracoccaceae bacterium]
MASFLVDPFSHLSQVCISTKGIYSSLQNFTKILANSIEPLLFLIPDSPDTPISRFGTALKVRCNDSFFLVCTEHQFKDADPESVVLIHEKNQKLITSHETVFFGKLPSGEPITDLRLFNFTLPVKSGEISETGWWDYHDRVTPEVDDFDFLVAVGYPSFSNAIDYDRLDLRLAPRGVFGLRENGALSGLSSIRLVNDLPYDPDGLSGSPAFALVKTSFGFTTKLAGIVSNAGRSQLNYLKIDDLSGLLEYALRSR